MSEHDERTYRERIEGLFAQLREAAATALARHAIVASKLDDSRGELERLLMLEHLDERETLRAIGRAQLMLDAWRGMLAEPVVERAVRGR
jgi:hypothetical protein